MKPHAPPIRTFPQPFSKQPATALETSPRELKAPKATSQASSGRRSRNLTPAQADIEAPEAPPPQEEAAQPDEDEANSDDGKTAKAKSGRTRKLGQYHMTQIESAIQGMIAQLPLKLNTLAYDSFSSKVNSKTLAVLAAQMKAKSSVCTTHFTELEIPLNKSYEAACTVAGDSLSVPDTFGLAPIVLTLINKPHNVLRSVFFLNICCGSPFLLAVTVIIVIAGFPLFGPPWVASFHLINSCSIKENPHFK